MWEALYFPFSRKGFCTAWLLFLSHLGAATVRCWSANFVCFLLFLLPMWEFLNVEILIMCSTLFIHFLNLWFFWLELNEPDFWEDHSLRVGPGSSCIFTLGGKKKGLNQSGREQQTSVTDFHCKQSHFNHYVQAVLDFRLDLRVSKVLSS